MTGSSGCNISQLEPRCQRLRRTIAFLIRCLDFRVPDPECRSTTTTTTTTTTPTIAMPVVVFLHAARCHQSAWSAIRCTRQPPLRPSAAACTSHTWMSDVCHRLHFLLLTATAAAARGRDACAPLHAPSPIAAHRHAFPPPSLSTTHGICSQSQG